jgi:hypothetical protein
MARGKWTAESAARSRLSPNTRGSKSGIPHAHTPSSKRSDRGRSAPATETAGRLVGLSVSSRSGIVLWDVLMDQMGATLASAVC